MMTAGSAARLFCHLALLIPALVLRSNGQTLTVSPAQILQDQTIIIRAAGLQPNEQAVIAATLRDGHDVQWKSKATFVADAQGNLDLSAQAPVKGSYKDKSSTGLIWSMMPQADFGGAYTPPPDLGAQEIVFELQRHDSTIAKAELRELAVAEGVSQKRVTGQLHGVLFLPAEAGRQPCVLVLGGSEGGAPLRRAAWLASHGYVALALAYFKYDDLPKTLEAIPLEYFGEAIGWLLKRPDVDPDHLAVMGVSRGGELALLLGSMFPQIQAVVAYSGASFLHSACCGDNLVRYAWTWKAQPLAFARLETGPDAMRAAIRVENTKGPILLIAGTDDHVWNSSEMVKAVAARLKREHFPYQVEVLIYPHAGHIAGRPQLTPEWYGNEVRSPSGKGTDYGGTVAGNALSSIDAIPKVLDFLKRSFAR